MKNLVLVFVLFFSVLAGCVSIQKPDWNPGDTPPEPQKGERQMCPLPAQWGWNAKYKQWICAPMPTCYGSCFPSVYYGPPAYYGPSVYPWGYCR